MRWECIYFSIQPQSTKLQIQSTILRQDILLRYLLNPLHLKKFFKLSHKIKTSLALNWLQITRPVTGKTHFVQAQITNFRANNSSQADSQPSCLSVPWHLEASPAHFLENRTREKKFATICCRCYGDFPIFIFPSSRRGLAFYILEETREDEKIVRVEEKAREICRSLLFDIAFLDLHVRIWLFFLQRGC